MMRGMDETWQAYLVDMSTYSWFNIGYKYLLTIIDIFSKYAWAIPTKTKRGKDITDAMNSVLKKDRVPQKLHADKGKEFHNSELKGKITISLSPIFDRGFCMYKPKEIEIQE